MVRTGLISLVILGSLAFSSVKVAKGSPGLMPEPKTESGKKIDLAGTWKFAADPLEKGIREKWFLNPLKETVLLPGSMSTNGKGDEITLKTRWTGQIVDSSYYKDPAYARYREPGNIKVPFWLQPLKHYQGAAWYQKEINVPATWEGDQVILFLERCHWESRLWVDDHAVGMQNSLGTPHRYDLTSYITPGRHTLTLCIDNRIKDIDPGINSHSVSDHTQTNWNGVVGRMYLEARPSISLDNIQVFPDSGNRKLTARIRVNNNSGRVSGAQVILKIPGQKSLPEKTALFNLATGINALTMEFPVGNSLQKWDEFHPVVYSLQATLTGMPAGRSDTLVTTFGIRELRTSGRQLLINGHPLFLRGTLECAIFPKTGYPPADTAAWARIFRICKAHGLNHMRFHSWCPPEAAFTAADLAGFYLHVECSSWCNQSTRLGDGNPFDKYLYEESRRMVETYGNHPSFCMMAYGNEPGGPHHAAFLSEFVTYWKKQDNRRLYTTAAGWPLLEVSDYLSSPNPRIQAWGQGLKSIINGSAPSTSYDWSAFINKYNQPVVSHEIGQWCVYPDFREISQYDGVVRARNFEIFRESLENHGMISLADSFLLASGKLQALCYKADIEAALRTKDMAGFQLLDLHDFPGQGTALVGVLNAFWGEKGYVSPQEYSRFCNSTVPLARMKKCLFTNDEKFEADIEVAHFGAVPLKSCKPAWKITGRDGRILLSGKLPKTDVILGNCIRLGKISFPLSPVKTATQFRLEVAVGQFVNGWDFWVFPAQNKPVNVNGKIRIVSTLDQGTLDFLNGGGDVLLAIRKGTLGPVCGGKIQAGFSSIFWNTAWTRGQAPHTLGILCNPVHPALSLFPTEYHSNWQWWDTINQAGAIDLSSFPAGIKPIVRIIDDWFTNRPLALILEAKVGKGRIIVSAADLVTGMENRPGARQLLYSLEQYMAGNLFHPSVELPASLLQKLID